jgi:hypothetical protein
VKSRKITGSGGGKSNREIGPRRFHRRTT